MYALLYADRAPNTAVVARSPLPLGAYSQSGAVWGCPPLREHATKPGVRRYQRVRTNQWRGARTLPSSALIVHHPPTGCDGLAGWGAVLPVLTVTPITSLVTHAAVWLCLLCGWMACPLGAPQGRARCVRLRDRDWAWGVCGLDVPNALRMGAVTAPRS